MGKRRLERQDFMDDWLRQTTRVIREVQKVNAESDWMDVRNRRMVAALMASNEVLSKFKRTKTQITKNLQALKAHYPGLRWVKKPNEHQLGLLDEKERVVFNDIMERYPNTPFSVALDVAFNSGERYNYNREDKKEQD